MGSGGELYSRLSLMYLLFAPLGNTPTNCILIEFRVATHGPSISLYPSRTTAKLMKDQAFLLLYINCARWVRAVGGRSAQCRVLKEVTKTVWYQVRRGRCRVLEEVAKIGMGGWEC